MCSSQEAALGIHTMPRRCWEAWGKSPLASVPQCQSPNLKGSLQWSCGQPAWRLGHFSDNVRSLPLWLSFFCCSLDDEYMCQARGVLEAGRPNGELAAPFHLDTLEGRQEREAESLSPILRMGLIYSPAGESRQRACSWLSSLVRLEGGRQDRTGKGPVSSFQSLSLVILPSSCLAELRHQLCRLRALGGSSVALGTRSTQQRPRCCCSCSHQ